MVLVLSHEPVSPRRHGRSLHHPCARPLRRVAGLIAAICVAGAGATAVAQGGFDDGAWGDAEGFFEEDEGGDDYEQPPVTSGGMYTKDSYPVAEIERPLTMTQGIAELGGALDFDLSADRAFEVFYSHVQARYGLRDHIELQAAYDGLLAGQIGPADLAAGNHQAEMALGIEAAIAYDLVNVRATAEIPLMPDRAFDLALGAPVRYRATSQLAIIAADRLLTIHTDGRKPDLTAGIGALYQIVPELAATVRAEITLFGFNTDLDPLIPVTASVQYSPTHLVDLGLQLAFANLGADEGRFDRRFALLFGRLRI